MDAHASPHGTLGALEIGSSLSLFLFGILTVQAYLYFDRFRDDRWTLKAFVGVLWIFELAHTILIAQEVYTTSISDWGSPDKLRAPFTSLVVTIIFGSLITCMVQIMFAIRIRTISGSPWIMLFCSFLAVLSFVGGVVVAAEGLILNSLASFYPKFGWLITSSLTVGAFVDVVIAASMCFYLKQHTPVFMDTNEIVKQLIAWTVQTGVVTSVTAISLVITFQTVVPTNFAWLTLYTVLTKVYTNSMLASLNGRMKFRGKAENSVNVNSVMLEFQAPSTTNQTSGGSDIGSRPGEGHALEFVNPNKASEGTKTESTARSYS